jgi:hypothetical protein
MWFGVGVRQMAWQGSKEYGHGPLRFWAFFGGAPVVLGSESLNS